ncbi:hypothetical protein DSL72_003957 [Monilinia vaccinii-corymbosi]|uniref:AAA+ ATPase lid domain-containing protein n=1 Tax=Monilinia vaccinii-corymbosi TaxID=61207 RepID=A0A8A3NVC9_9HELO|nr:hypothetical protein DSL72_003957 [Monilinia vaccinii-corymbosi]
MASNISSYPRLHWKLEVERADEITIQTAAQRYILLDDLLKDIEWNGREIRTAAALAEYEAETKGTERGEEGGTLEVELRWDLLKRWWR